MSRFLAVVALLALTCSSASAADEKKIELTITGGKVDAKNVPVVVPLEVTPEMAKTKHVGIKRADSKDTLIGQWTGPGLLTENIPAKDKALVRRDLHFIIPELKAGATVDSDAGATEHWRHFKTRIQLAR